MGSVLVNKVSSSKRLVLPAPKWRETLSGYNKRYSSLVKDFPKAGVPGDKADSTI